MLGRLLSLPVRIANAPLRAIERIVDPDMTREQAKREGMPSSFLSSVADAIEEIDDDENSDRSAQ